MLLHLHPISVAIGLPDFTATQVAKQLCTMLENALFSVPGPRSSAL